MFPTNSSRAQVPSTPIRRARYLSQRSITLLKQRVRRMPASQTPPLPSAFPDLNTTIPSAMRRRANHYCAALLNEPEDDDIVVVTALDVLPFCCHADLMLMPRAALEEAANALNARLPTIFQLDMKASDSDLRGGIELLVGLRPVGKCTNAVSTRSLFRCKDKGTFKPLSSPLGEYERLALRTVQEDSGEWSDIVMRGSDSSTSSTCARNINTSSTSAKTFTEGDQPPSKKRKISPSILFYDWDSLSDAQNRTGDQGPRSKSPNHVRLSGSFLERGESEQALRKHQKPRLQGARC